MTDEYKKFLNTASEQHLGYLIKEAANKSKIAFEKIHYILTSPEIENKPSINKLGNFVSDICFSASVEQIKFLMTSAELSEHFLMIDNTGLIAAADSDNVEVVKFLIENVESLDLYTLNQYNKNELVSNCFRDYALKTINYLCFEYKSEDNKMLKNFLEFCVYDNSIYFQILKNPKFPKDLFHPDELFKIATDAKVFEHLVNEYNYDLTKKDIPQLFKNACSKNGDALLYLLKREDFKDKYDIHMDNDIIFDKLMNLQAIEMIEDLIFNSRLQVTPSIQANMDANKDSVVKSLFKARDICDMKEKLEFDLLQTKKLASIKI